MAQIQPPRAMGEATTSQSEDSIWSERTNPAIKAPAKEKEIQDGSRRQGLDKISELKRQ